jgi:hypothetical protein
LFAGHSSAGGAFVNKLTEAAKQSRPAIGLYLSEVPNNWQGKCMGNMETLLAFLRRQE